MSALTVTGKFSQRGTRRESSAAAVTDENKTTWSLPPSAVGFISDDDEDIKKQIADWGAAAGTSSSSSSSSSSAHVAVRKTGWLQQLQPNDGGSVPSHRGFYRSVSAESDLSETDFDLRPLIKEELRNSIHKRRCQHGLLDWGMDDYDKKRSRHYQLTPEELMKREDRKKRNRLAAAKCREKRRKRTEELQETMENLETRQRELIKQKEFLSHEKQDLRKMVEDHFKMCHQNLLRAT